MGKTAAVQGRPHPGAIRRANWPAASKKRKGTNASPVSDDVGGKQFTCPEPATSRVEGVLREFMFPGFADTKDRLRAVACGIVNLLLARILFAWPLGLATIHGTLPVQGPAWFGVPAGIGFLYGTLFTLFCQTEGVYRPPARFAVRGGAASVFKAAIWAWLVVESTVFLVKESPGLSLLISVSACLHLGCIAGFLALRSKVVEHPVDQGTTVRHIVIVGTGGTAVVLASRLRAEGHLGRQFEGFVDDPHPGRPETLGLIQDLESLAQTRFLDEVIVCLPDEPAAARRAVFLARRLSLDVKVVPEVYGCTLPYDGTEMAGDIPVLTLQTLKRAEVAPILKRALDVASAAGLLLLLAPALCLIALLIRINSPGCVFYSAQRVGRKGRAFLCYKFRTMRTDADEQKHVLRVRNERSGPFFKLKDDPRITTVGKWLRKYSLDELPQLWNILLGDMSLVGPRPHPLDDHARYAAEHLLRLTVTPGLTGLWQVTARSDPSFERSMALDREYIAKQSFWMDLWILFRTVREVAVGSGV